MAYQKVYMNQIFSSSLIGQLAYMWRKDLMCDAVIKTGNTCTKAHRLVMIAACPMLQHMENASLGSHLEVRLSSEVSKDSVQMFLQYLYEGYMKLTEKNYREIEKIAKLLQVDSILKCCLDFAKCLNQQVDSQYGIINEFGVQDQQEFKYVKSTDLEKTFSSTESERLGRSDLSVRLNYDGRSDFHGDFDSQRRDFHERRQPRSLNTRQYASQSASNSRQSTCTQPEQDPLNYGVEVINLGMPGKDSEGWPIDSGQPPIQHSMGVAISTDTGARSDRRVINITDNDVQVTSPPHTKPSLQKSSFQSNLRYTTTSNVQPEPSSGQALSSSSHAGVHRMSPPASVNVQKDKSFSAGSANQKKEMEARMYLVDMQTNQPLSAGNISTAGMDQTMDADKTSDSITSMSSRKFPGPEVSIIKIERVENLPNEADGIENIYVQQVSPASGSDGEDSDEDQDEAMGHNSDRTDTCVFTEVTNQGGLQRHQLINNSMETNIDQLRQTDETTFVSNTAGPRSEFPDYEVTIIKTEPDESATIDQEDVQSHDTQTIIRSDNATVRENHSSNVGRNHSSNVGSSTSTGGQMGTLNQWNDSNKESSLQVRLKNLVPTIREQPSLNPSSNKPVQCRYIGCMKTFNSEESFKQHLSQVKKHGKVAACTKCGKFFMSKEGHKIHYKTKHMGVRSEFQCKECGKQFLTVTYLRQHEASHSDYRPFQCNMCSRAFKLKYQLLKHMRDGKLVHQKGSSASSSSFSVLKKKKNTKNKDKDSGLPDSSKQEKSPDKGKSKTSVVKSQRQGSAVMKCNECSRNFSSKSAIMAHLNSKHNRQLKEYCCICEKGFKSKNGFFIHDSLKHSTTCNFPRCKICGNQFASPSNLKVHMNVHSNRKSTK